jgi:hypothetical protein
MSIQSHILNLNSLIDKIIAVKDSEVAPLFARINELELQLRNTAPELAAAIGDRDAALLALTTAQAAQKEAETATGVLQADLDEAVLTITKLEKELEAALVVPAEGPSPLPPVVVPPVEDPKVETPVVVDPKVEPTV